MKHIVLIAIAICAGTSVHAPELKKSKCVSHPLHDAAGVSSPFLDQTKGNGLAYELKMLKDSIDKKKRAKKRRRGWQWIKIFFTSLLLHPLAILAAIGALFIDCYLNFGNKIVTAGEIIVFGTVFSTYAGFVIFTLYAFCKGCTLLAQGYGRRRKYQTIAL